jgi:hypothetical protein
MFFKYLASDSPAKRYRRECIRDSFPDDAEDLSDEIARGRMTRKIIEGIINSCKLNEFYSYLAILNVKDKVSVADSDFVMAFMLEYDRVSSLGH